MDEPAEKALLVDYLGGQRRHVLQQVDGLDEEAMNRPVLPSGWTITQLLRHLALDNERFWFTNVVDGHPIDDGADVGWTVPDGFTVVDAVALYRAEAVTADAVIARTPLDAPPAWWPAFLGEWRMDHLCEVILHHLTETAVHAGQLDAVRELIDGHQWRVQG